jgi:hypothetical protein
MELRKPPPVRRLTGNQAYALQIPVAPPPPDAQPHDVGSNGNGQRPNAGFAMPPRRTTRDGAIAIDRVHVEQLSVCYAG